MDEFVIVCTLDLALTYPDPRVTLHLHHPRRAFHALSFITKLL